MGCSSAGCLFVATIFVAKSKRAVGNVHAINARKVQTHVTHNTSLAHAAEIRFNSAIHRLQHDFFLIASSSHSQSAVSGKPQIAVLNLEGRGISENDAATLSERLRGQLVKTNAFIVIDRENMDKTLGEQGFQMTGCTRVACAVRAGQILNAKKIVLGSIGKLGATYAVDISVIDVESGQIERSFNKDHRGKIDGLLEILAAIAVEMSSSARPGFGAQAQSKHQLKIYSSPSGAEVTINGKFMGKTPLSGNVPHPSKLKIIIRREGYAEWQQSLTMENDSQLNAELAPLQAGSSKTWLWVAGGAAAIGTTAYVLLSGRESNGGTSESLPAFPWPPR